MIQQGDHRAPGAMRCLNELVYDDLADRGRTQPAPFFCECDEPGCYRTVWLTPDQYRRARRDPDWVALAARPGLRHSAAA